MFTAVRKLRAQRQGMIQELVSDIICSMNIVHLSYDSQDISTFPEMG